MTPELPQRCCKHAILIQSSRLTCCHLSSHLGFQQELNWGGTGMLEPSNSVATCLLRCCWECWENNTDENCDETPLNTFAAAGGKQLCIANFCLAWEQFQVSSSGQQTGETFLKPFMELSRTPGFKLAARDHQNICRGENIWKKMRTFGKSTCAHGLIELFPLFSSI